MCVVSIAMALALVSVVPTAAAQMSTPVWASGDYWVFTSSGSGGIGGLPGGILRFDVVGTDSITVGTSTFSAYHTKLNLTFSETSGGTTTTITALGDAWFRTADLSLAKMTVSASVLGFSFSITVVYSPPPTIQWPLTTNASWSVDSTVTTTTVSGSITQTNSTIQSGQESVLADTSLVVAAGSFTTTPLKQTLSGTAGYTVDYWSSATGFWVSERNYNALGTQTGGMDLTSYSYTPQTGALDVVVLLLIGLVIAAVMSAGMTRGIVVITGVVWAYPARLVYGEVLRLRMRGFVEAGEAMGAGGLRIVRRHLAPHVTSMMIAYSPLNAASAVAFEATLSYLSAGINPPTASLGNMISDGQAAISYAPLLAIAPGLAIVALIVAITLTLLIEGMPSIQKFGLGFLVSQTWNPVSGVFGALPFIYGTIVSSAIAIFLASIAGVRSRTLTPSRWASR